MRVLLLFCHPVEDSYHAALHRTARAALERARHRVDDCDLYGEGFCPVLSREERVHYHDVPRNRLGAVLPGLDLPAMLKGFFDRIFLPGVSFDLGADGRGRPRRIVTRVLRAQIRPPARVLYLAHYHMNVSTAATRERFLSRVERAMAAF